MARSCKLSSAGYVEEGFFNSTRHPYSCIPKSYGSSHVNDHASRFMFSQFYTRSNAIRPYDHSVRVLGILFKNVFHLTLSTSQTRLPYRYATLAQCPKLVEIWMTRCCNTKLRHSILRWRTRTGSLTAWAGTLTILACWGLHLHGFDLPGLMQCKDVVYFACLKTYTMVDTPILYRWPVIEISRFIYLSCGVAKWELEDGPYPSSDRLKSANVDIIINLL